jgi:parallel beta-helix repeat protein
MPTSYYVSGSGSDYQNGLTPEAAFRDIQRAADLTIPGDTVYVMDGIYASRAAASDVVSITRSGTANEWISYRAYPGAKPKLVSDTWHAFAILGASYIIIDGFDLQGNNDNITLQQAIAEQGNLNNPLTSGNGIGVRASWDSPSTYPHNIIIRNNKIHDFGGGGIGTNNADYVTIENNTVYNNGWYSPYSSSGISTYQNWNFDDNAGYKMLINGNTLYNNQNLIPWLQTGEITDGNGIIVDDTRNTQNGSTLGIYQGRTLIENNVAYNNGGSGIHVYEADFVDILNNTTYQNSRSSEINRGEISAIDANDVRVFNNIMSATPGKSANSLLNVTNVVFDYNLLFNSSNYDLAGKNDVIGVDPQFSNPASGNFALNPYSPAIDKGISGFTNRDIWGNPRPLGSGIDLGAFEGA